MNKILDLPRASVRRQTSRVTQTDYESYLKAAQPVLHEQEVVGRGVLRALECAQRLVRAVEPLEQQLHAVEQLLQLLHAELRALPARTRATVHLYLYSKYHTN